MRRHNSVKQRSLPIITWLRHRRENLMTFLSILLVVAGAFTIFMLGVGFTSYIVLQLWLFFALPVGVWTADVILVIACLIDLILLALYIQHYE